MIRSTKENTKEKQIEIPNIPYKGTLVKAPRPINQSFSSTKHKIPENVIIKAKQVKYYFFYSEYYKLELLKTLQKIIPPIIIKRMPKY